MSWYRRERADTKPFVRLLIHVTHANRECRYARKTEVRSVVVVYKNGDVGLHALVQPRLYRCVSVKQRLPIGFVKFLRIVGGPEARDVRAADAGDYLCHLQIASG